MPAFTYRRVVALTRDRRKLFGLTTDDIHEANAILHNGLFLFGQIRRSRHGFKIKQSRKTYVVPRTAELCFFPEW